MKVAPFFVLALPRSRTKWLSVALTHGVSTCLHEAWRNIYTSAEFCARLGAVRTEVVGNSGCANALMLDRLITLWPDCRLLVIDRDTAQVRASLGRLGWSDKSLNSIRTGMDRALRRPGTLCVRYSDIDARGLDIWTHCVGKGFDNERWNGMTRRHIEVDKESEERSTRPVATRALLGGGSWDL